MTEYTPTVTREGRWWLVTVPGVGVTQARRIADVERAAAELVAVSLDIPVEEVDVAPASIRLPDGVDVTRCVEEINDEREAAARLERQAAADLREFARYLEAAEVPLRDIGTMLGISHQRVHQLVHADSAATLRRRA